LSETETFLATVLPRLKEMDVAFHNGDVGPRFAIWSHEDPVTLFGALFTESGWGDVSRAFEWLASRFSNGTFDYEVIAAGASGDLGYIVGIEHTTASVLEAAPEAYELRVTTILRREGGEWKVVHRHADPMPRNDAADRQLSRLEGGS
jgi:ketosteroid isomerase-like protein